MTEPDLFNHDYYEKDDDPITPYNGTSGWSGSTTSAERAVESDSNGITKRRQDKTYADLNRAGMQGLTWKDLAAANDWHHGQASGVLSVMHKEGVIARLTERRDKCEIYILLKYVFDREVSPYRQTQPKSEYAAQQIESLRQSMLLELQTWWNTYGDNMDLDPKMVKEYFERVIVNAQPDNSWI